MLDEFKTQKKVVGLKQTQRAVSEGIAITVYAAKDADVRVLAPIIKACEASNIKVIYIDTMQQLGQSAGIDVGAALAAIIK